MVSERSSTENERDLLRQFPILQRTVHGKRLVYLDNAATTQKPQAVIDAITRYYTMSNSNVHRGGHALGVEATDLYESARSTVATFLNAASPDEIVFTKGATEAINLIATTFGKTAVQEGDEVVVTTMEHHANIVPWHMLCQERGAKLLAVRIHDDGSLDLDHLTELLDRRPKILALTHVSNTLGTVNPVADICAMARSRGVVTIVDGAQAVPHVPVDVQAIGCDFYVFSAHKLYGPTGFGALYGRADMLDAMPPYQGGGSMIDSVSFDDITYNDVPMRFEAGTPHIGGAVGTEAAIRWFTALDRAALAEHEDALLDRLTARMEEIADVRIIGTTPNKTGIVSFVVNGVHASDIGTLLDTMGVAIRVGHHCTQPLLRFYQITSTARASFAAYNTMDDVDDFVQALHKAIGMLR